MLTFNDILREIIASPEDRKSWEKLCLFPTHCLGRPKRGGKKTKLASHINTQVRNFNQGVSEPAPVPTNRKLPNISAQVSNKIRASDIRGAVRIVSSNDKILENTPETLSKLEGKHPPAHPDTQMPDPPSPENIGAGMIATREDVKNAIKSFRNGSGGGPNGLLRCSPSI